MKTQSKDGGLATSVADPLAGRVEALRVLSRFRTGLYGCLASRCDALFELGDALVCPDRPVKSLVDLTLLPEHRRGHGGMYDALNHGGIEVDRLRTALAELPLPRFGGRRLVLAVDVSPWLRPDAACSPDRLFCHTYGRGKGQAQMIPGDPAKERYGLELMKATGLASGTLYPVLARLEGAGWLVSGREDPLKAEKGRPPRRYYRLTGIGAGLARTELQYIQAQVGAVTPSVAQKPSAAWSPA